MNSRITDDGCEPCDIRLLYVSVAWAFRLTFFSAGTIPLGKIDRVSLAAIDAPDYSGSINANIALKDGVLLPLSKPLCGFVWRFRFVFLSSMLTVLSVYDDFLGPCSDRFTCRNLHLQSICPITSWIAITFFASTVGQSLCESHSKNLADRSMAVQRPRLTNMEYRRFCDKNNLLREINRHMIILWLSALKVKHRV